MSDVIEIPAHESGVVRLFAVDLPDAEARAYRSEAAGDGSAWPLQQALGARVLEAGHVEVFPVSDLEGLGLAGYLTEGQGVAEEALDRSRLEGLGGHVAVIRSAAFGGVKQTLTPRPPLRLIATYREAPPETPPIHLEAESAAPSEAPTPPDPARRDRMMSGRVAMIALVVLALLVILMLWVAA